MTRERYTDEQVVEVLKEIQAGKFVSDVAKERGITEASIIIWCRKTGVTYKRKTSVYYRDWEAIKHALNVTS